MRGKWLDQNDKAYLSRQMTTDFANRIPIEILRSGPLASKFSRLYCIMDESIFQSFSKKRLNRWLNLPILSAATFFRRRSFYSFKHEKCLYRSINAYFYFRLSIRCSRSPFELLFRLFLTREKHCGDSVRRLTPRDPSLPTGQTNRFLAKKSVRQRPLFYDNFTRYVIIYDKTKKLTNPFDCLFSGNYYNKRVRFTLTIMQSFLGGNARANRAIGFRRRKTKAKKYELQR